MIIKLSDNKRVIEVGKNGVSKITEWSVDKDKVDIYRIADSNNEVIEFKGYLNKDYEIEYKEGNSEQLTLF